MSNNRPQESADDGVGAAQGPTRKSFVDDEMSCPIFGELDLTDAFVSSGKILPWPLDPEHPDFINIQEYITNSQDLGFWFTRVFKIVSILRLFPTAYTRPGDPPIVEFKDDPRVAGQSRMMLWYGTNKEKVASILENGLTSEDPEQGIHFSDRFLQSVRNCDPTWYPLRYPPTSIPAKKYGYLLLCDVLLGHIMPAPSINAANTAATHVKKAGGLVPDPTGDRLIDGCLWPMGTTIVVPAPVAWHGGLINLFNDYIIRSEKQIQLKYLVKVELA